MEKHMRWIGLLAISCLLSACIFVEGQIIEEPEDVVISPHLYQYIPDYPCQSTSVTAETRLVKRCPS